MISRQCALRRASATKAREQLPDAVGIEFERLRHTIAATLAQDAESRLIDGLQELCSLGADAASLGSIVQRLPVLAPRLSGPGGLEAWLTALREVVQHAPHCTLALLESSEEVLRYGSPAELLTWTRFGLHQGQRLDDTEADTRLAHFELRSRASTRVMSGRLERTDLASNKARLGYLLRALFGVAPPLLPVEQDLATRRPFLSNLGLHLPEASRALRGILAQQWYNAAATHAAAHLIYSTHKFERGALKPIQAALVGVLEDARVELLASSDLPGLRHLWLTYHTASPEHGNTFTILMLRLARSLLDAAYEDPHPWVIKGKRLFFEATEAAQTPERLAPVILRDLASRLGNDIGQMRLQFNYRQYVVEPPYRDDNAHLWLDEEEQKAQLLFTNVPSPQSTDATDDSPVKPPQEYPPPLVESFQYQEWDRLIGNYRGEWCTVLEGRQLDADASALRTFVDGHGMLLQRIQRALCAGRLRERVKLRAQLRGDELDVDAAVRSQIDRRVHRTSSDKVYQRHARRLRDVAALLLIDASESTADPVQSGGDVLGLARRAALMTTLALADAGDLCAIDSFCSNGRHEVSYELAVDFGELLDEKALARLAAIRSRWSTRMGAALRHATKRLAAQRQRRRLLLMITDGEPHDIDIYDRRYLIEDAKRAVLEARLGGVHVFCVTLDRVADDYVQTIFGRNNYRVLDRIESLPHLLPQMVARMTR